jgi:hypothetical protein
MKNIPKRLLDNVLVDHGIDMKGTGIIKGYDFNKGLDYQALFAEYKNMGI